MKETISAQLDRHQLDDLEAFTKATGRDRAQLLRDVVTLGLLLLLRGRPGLSQVFERMVERGMRLDAALALRAAHELRRKRR